VQESLNFVCSSTGGKIIHGHTKHIITSIATDSRRITPGSLFIALKGERYDGHDFVLEALNKGCSAALITRPLDTAVLSQDQTLILVEDTLQALQELASAYRQKFNIPIVAVTGSVGKTTTKELIATCFATRWKTLKTQANYNNDIGLPLTLLQLDASHEIAVVEMGMRGLGEIQRLTGIARPNFALISNVEPVHLETMGSLENIARAKCEVLAGLPDDGFALINGDNELLVIMAKAYHCRKYTFGYNKACDFQILDCHIKGTSMEIKMRAFDNIETLFFPLPAVGIALDVVSAASLANLLGIDFQTIRNSLHNYRTIGSRLQIINLIGGGAIINDTYNANPVSMTAALKTGCQLAGNGKYAAILGNMYELGSLEVEAHLSIGKKAYESGVDLLVAVGSLARDIAQGAIHAGMNPNQVHHFPTKEEAVEYLKNTVDNSWFILFKASRGMQLESILNKLLEEKCLSAKKE
jgi:UDP-N-acetylmuramoyl-tripeptide--D-alanyl-D-alanine ligase